MNKSNQNQFSSSLPVFKSRLPLQNSNVDDAKTSTNKASIRQNYIDKKILISNSNKKIQVTTLRFPQNVKKTEPKSENYASTMNTSNQTQSKLPVFKSRLPLPNSNVDDAKTSTNKASIRPNYIDKKISISNSNKGIQAKSLRLPQNVKKAELKSANLASTIKKSNQLVKSEKVSLCNKDYSISKSKVSSLNDIDKKTSFPNSNKKIQVKTLRFPQNVKKTEPKSAKYASTVNKSNNLVKSEKVSFCNKGRSITKPKVTNLNETINLTEETRIQPIKNSSALQTKNYSKLKAVILNKRNSGIPCQNHESFIDVEKSVKAHSQVNETICIEPNTLNVTTSCDHSDGASNLNSTFNSSSTNSSSELLHPIVSDTVEKLEEPEIDNVELSESNTGSAKDYNSELNTTYKDVCGNSYIIDNGADSVNTNNDNNTFSCEVGEIPKEISEQNDSLICSMRVASNENLVNNDSYVVNKVSEDQVTPELNLTFDLRAEEKSEEKDNLNSQMDYLEIQLDSESFTDATESSAIKSPDENSCQPIERNNLTDFISVSPMATISTKAAFALSPIMEDPSTSQKIDENKSVLQSYKYSSLSENDSKNRISTTSDESLGILNVEELDTSLISDTSFHEIPTYSSLPHHIQNKRKLTNNIELTTSLPQTSSPIFNHGFNELSELSGLADWISPVETESSDNHFNVDVILQNIKDVKS